MPARVGRPEPRDEHEEEHAVVSIGRTFNNLPY
jgi:hypothetical protein